MAGCPSSLLEFTGRLRLAGSPGLEQMPGFPDREASQWE